MTGFSWEFSARSLKSRWIIHRIVAEPGDVSLIARIEENWSSGLLPVFVINKISLFEGAILQESKVIDLQCEKRKQKDSIMRAPCGYGVEEQCYVS